MKNIRNFAIIAHIDHGKSTLADRFLELTHIVDPGKHEEQMLDRNPISRERGITIKLAPVSMQYEYKETTYQLNLVDTPGHVDFSYEVERTLACVEGAILLVDATQGIQAQTIAHAYKALEQNLTIIPVVNKVDLPHAQVEKTKKELVEFLGVSEDSILEVSAKTGQNVEKLLQRVIDKVSEPSQSVNPVPVSFPPVLVKEAKISVSNDLTPISIASRSEKHDIELPSAKALIFDSYYDQYRGVIAFIRVFNGNLKQGSKLRLVATNTIIDTQEVGIFKPDLTPSPTLNQGMIGYIVTNLKDIHQVQVGDTLVDASVANPKLLAGYKKSKPMVFASIFTTDPDQYINLKKSLEKLTLNDSALTYEPIYSKALGSGFRCGFLGILHGDVVRERLEREFDLSLILTPPTVEYIPDPASPTNKKMYLEPIAEVNIVVPQEYVGSTMQLCEESRATFLTMDNKAQVYLSYEMPLIELITNFFDKLKNITSGYASLDWHFKRYQSVVADKMEILLNGEPVEEFSDFVVFEKAQEKAREITQKLRDLIPRQQYEVKIQASFKGKIVASERLSPFRKDVLVKSGKVLGAGDVGRKKKLLERQKEGKKQMKNIGRVEIPKEAFLKLFRRDS